MFFTQWDNWKTLFFIKVYFYSEDFFSRHPTALFERGVLKEVRNLRYLYNNSTIPIPKLKNKVYTCKVLLCDYALFHIFLNN